MEKKPQSEKDSHPQQQPIYIQVPYGNAVSDADEISLVDLWLSLAKQKWVFVVVPGVCVALALAYVLFFQSDAKLYESKMIFLPPMQADVLPFKQGGEENISSAQLFERFSVSLLSRKNQSEYFDEFELLDKIKEIADVGEKGRKPLNKERVYNRFHNTISIELSEPIDTQSIVVGDDAYNENKSKVSTIENFKRLKNKFGKKIETIRIQQITLSVKGEEAQLISDLINGFGAFAERQTINDHINDLDRKRAQKIESLHVKIKQLKARTKQSRENSIIRSEEQDRIAEQKIADQVSVLRVKAKTVRLAEIQRLEENDKLSKFTIEEQIVELRERAETQRLDMIAQLNEALVLAKNLEIKRPSYISVDDSRTQGPSDVGRGAVAALSEISKQGHALYLKGEDTLKEEIRKLKARQSNDPFISGFRTLQGKLRQLETNEKIEILKSRLNDDPFISELPELQQQLTLLKQNRQLESLRERMDDQPYIDELVGLNLHIKRLNTIVYDADSVRSAIVSQHAFPSNNPLNKSNKTQVILLALALGFLVAVFAAFLLSFLSKIGDSSSVKSASKELKKA